MRTVHSADRSDSQQGASYIIFPVAVGAVFLAMLVAGALIG